MQQKDITAGQIFAGIEPGRIVKVVAAIPKDAGCWHLVYRSEDGSVKEKLILKEQLDGISGMTMARRFSFWNVNAASIKHIPATPQRQEADDSEEMTFHWISTVLLAGIWLMENDWGKMRFLPYVYALGTWRCAFHLRGRPKKPFFTYSSAMNGHFLSQFTDSSIAKDVTPSELGRAIAAAVPVPLRLACRGKAPTDLRQWANDLRLNLQAGYIPAAFDNDYFSPSDPQNVWKMFALSNVTGSHSLKFIKPIPGFKYPL